MEKSSRYCSSQLYGILGLKVAVFKKPNKLIQTVLAWVEEVISPPSVHKLTIENPAGISQK